MNRTRFFVPVVIVMMIAMLFLSFGAVSAESDMMPRGPRVCMGMPAHVAVFSSEMGINCRNVGAMGVGIPSLISHGMTAIDLWSGMSVDAEVCFSIPGTITFLDASMTPRMPSTPAVYSRDNLTCAHITSGGTVIHTLGMMMKSDSMMMDDDMMKSDSMMKSDDMMKSDSMMMDDDMMEPMRMPMGGPACMGMLPMHVAVYSTNMGLHCRTYGSAPGSTVIDIWHPMGVDAEICFSTSGSITFFDASGMPRMASHPATFMMNNLNCIHITNGGTVLHRGM